MLDSSSIQFLVKYIIFFDSWLNKIPLYTYAFYLPMHLYKEPKAGSIQGLIFHKAVIPVTCVP